MIKRAQLFLFLLLLIPELVTSQEQKLPSIYHSFTYEIGINWLKEENLFPIVHKGSINGLTYRFEKRGKNYHEVSVTLRYSKIKAELETEKVSQNEQVSFGYCMGIHLLKRDKMNFYLGYNLKYAHSLVEFPVWDESRAYWATSLTLGLSNRLFVNTKENQSWIFNWDFNPMGFYSRPDEVRLYAQENWSFLSIVKTTNSNITPGFINNVFLSKFRTEYRFHTMKDHYFALLYTLSYSKIKRTNEHPQLSGINNFGISIGF
jgi:hypothetical protein